MTRSAVFSALRMRLVPERIPPGESRLAGRRCGAYRPLAIGAAIAVRPASAGGRWVMATTGDGLLRPRRPRSLPAAGDRVHDLLATGRPARVVVALLTPEDLRAPPADGEPAADLDGLRCDGYGWSLLYQSTGMRGLACIDPHDRFAELPAFYESPLEYLDRAAFLAERGIPSRPLVLVTQPDDFLAACDGRILNRFYPHASFATDRGPQG